jgi:hypothetical protein
LCPWSSDFDNLPADIQSSIIAYDRIAKHEDLKEKRDLLNAYIKSTTPKKKK